MNIMKINILGIYKRQPYYMRDLNALYIPASMSDDASLDHGLVHGEGGNTSTGSCGET